MKHGEVVELQRRTHPLPPKRYFPFCSYCFILTGRNFFRSIPDVRKYFRWKERVDTPTFGKFVSIMSTRSSKRTNVISAATSNGTPAKVPKLADEDCNNPAPVKTEVKGRFAVYLARAVYLVEGWDKGKGMS